MKERIIKYHSKSLAVNPRGWRPLAAGVLMLLGSSPHASAQTDPTPTYENSVTAYGGYRFGGSATDTTTNSAIDLNNGSSAALTVDVGIDPSRQIEFLYSQQHTALSSGAFSAQANNLGLTLRNFHIGGTNFIEEIGRGLYVMGGLGATTATPEQSGLNSETFFSGNLGIGWMLPLGAHVGLKFEARGYGIVLNHNGRLFCGGNSGCTIAVNGSGLFEGEVLAGLTARF
jgi:hypothetical protein